MATAQTLFSLKKSLTEEALSKSIGLVIRGKDSVSVVVKSNHVASFHELPNKNSNIFVWAIGGSELDVRNFRAEYLRFISRFSSIFSRRDVTIALIHDFAANYLTSSLYDVRSIEPTSLELILGLVTQNSMVFYTLNYQGKGTIIDDLGENISIVGSYDSNRKQLVEGLAKINTLNISGQETIKQITPLLRPFSGNIGALVCTITRVREKKQNKQKRK